MAKKKRARRSPKRQPRRNAGVDVSIDGRGFYQIAARSKRGTAWLRRVEGFDGVKTYTDSSSMAQNIADGAVRAGLKVEVNGRTYSPSKRNPFRKRKVPRVRTRRKRTVSRRRKTVKRRRNFFGFGSGTPAEDVFERQQKEARSLAAAGKFREAQKLARMKLRKYARLKGIKLEGRLRGGVRRRKRSLRASAHGAVDALLNPRRRNPVIRVPASAKATVARVLRAVGYKVRVK